MILFHQALKSMFTRNGILNNEETPRPWNAIIPMFQPTSWSEQFSAKFLLLSTFDHSPEGNIHRP